MGWYLICDFEISLSYHLYLGAAIDINTIIHWQETYMAMLYTCKVYVYFITIQHAVLMSLVRYLYLCIYNMSHGAICCTW